MANTPLNIPFNSLMKRHAKEPNKDYQRRYPGSTSKLDNNNKYDSMISEICDEIISEIGLSHSIEAYKTCIVKELKERECVVEKNVNNYIKYKGCDIGDFEVDILIVHKIVIMVNVKNTINDADVVRIRNYVRRYKYDYGYFVNFSQLGIQIQKVFHGGEPVCKLKDKERYNSLYGCVPLLPEDSQRHNTLGDKYIEDIAHTVGYNLGLGLKEAVYQKALKIEFEMLGHEVKSEDTQIVYYKGIEVCTIRSDLLIDNKIVLELKAINKITNTEVGQIRKYLRRYDFQYGFLINYSNLSVEVLKVVTDKV